MKRDDRSNPQQANGMMLAEVKHLKAQIALKDKRIKELEERLEAVAPMKDRQLTVQGGFVQVNLGGVSPEVATVATKPAP